MIDDRSEPASLPTADDRSVEEQRRILELELAKIRNEASAARLEAKAAEIELMIRGLRPAVKTDPPRSGTTSSGIPINPPHTADSSHHRFTSWDQLRRVLPTTSAVGSDPPDEVTGTETANTDPPKTATLAGESSDGFISSMDAPGPDSPGADVSVTKQSNIDHVDEAESDRPIIRSDAAAPAIKRPIFLDLDQDQPETINAAAEELSETLVVNEELEDESEARKGKPAAWLISAAAHVVILLALAAIGIQSQQPKDQVAITGSATEVREVSMETFEMESNEPVTEQTESSPSEVEYDLSPDGKIAVAELSADAPPAPPSPAAAAISSSTSAAAAMSLKSDSNAKIQFCGVEGGGNHFVYLVDCSSSMKAGFQSARKELLSSIEALTPKQRFYVVFFDAKSDYMRLHDVSQDEPRSVYATTENKEALRRWAMRVAMDRGKAPYDPLRFALKLKPDVIFLLSDGEFPQGIEDLLKEENKVANLFGDSSPISIVHTISYHSKEGESRMRRIAEQNQGQYRHVPKP